MEIFRRDLSNYVTKHKSTLKNDQNTYFPRIIFTPKTGQNNLKQVFRFYCDTSRRKDDAKNLNCHGNLPMLFQGPI